MPTVPLQYETLKSVLLYLEPNIRFQISFRMSSISSLESRLPLKIENLKFSQFDTKVNEVSYQVRVYRDYGRNEVPPDVLEMNEGGGSFNDIDQYGLTIYPGVNNVLPGDIDLRTGVQQDVPAHTEVEEQNLVLRLKVSKMILAERLNQEYIEDDETRNAIVDGPLNGFVENYRRATLNTSVESIQRQIQSLRDSLRPFNNRRNNQIPPCTPWIQLTTRSPKGVTIQRVAYNKYLHEARKTVHTKLFGNRDSSISLKNLNIEPHCLFSIHILRFPAETILKIENLEVALWNSLVFDRFKEVIHPSSLPIQQLKILSTIHLFDSRHTIVREAKILVINNNNIESGSWTPILQNLTNRRVYLENENRLNPPNNYVDLVENWLERGRPVGTTFSMGLKNEETAKQCLDTLRQREEVLGSSEKQVQLRIDAALMLNVSYEMIEHRYHNENASNLWLTLKVVRRRSE